MNPDVSSHQIPDVEAIMARIRAEATDFVEKGEAARASFRSHEANEEPGKRRPVQYSEDLHYLNTHWSDWATISEITSHRPVVGKLIVRVKRFFVDLVWNYLLKGYFERERQFQMHLVRYLNDNAKYIDDRDSELFWELIKKIDSDVQGVHERLDQLFDEAQASLRTLELQTARSQASLQRQQEHIQLDQETLRGSLVEIDGMLRGFERMIALTPLDKARGNTNEETAELHSLSLFPKDSIDYLLLENRYRGSEELIKERLSSYAELFAEVDGPVIDIGCGRGEFLEVLADADIEGFGVDMSEAMVACCLQKGLRAAQADCLAYLEQLADHSIGGIFGAQLIEHLTKEQLDTLLALAVKKVRPGGVIAFETINPQSVTALARNFFRDPTHVWPLHPDTMRFMMEMKGIATTDVLYRSPYPEDATLKPLVIAPELPPRWRQTLQSMNDNVDRLNALLFGFQDYCVVGYPSQGVFDDGRNQ